MFNDFYVFLSVLCLYHWPNLTFHCNTNSPVTSYHLCLILLCSVQLMDICLVSSYHYWALFRL